MIASQINPIPSVHEITAQKDAYLQEIQKEASAESSEYFKKNPRPEDPEERKQWEKDIQEWATEFRGRLTTKIDEKNAAIERDYQTKMHQQQKLAENLSRVSPTSAMMFGTMSLARTGVNEHDRFLSSVRTYKPIFTKWVNQKMGTDQPPQEGAQVSLDLSDMPQHEFIPEGLGDSFKRVLPDIILMVFLIIFFFVGAFVSFLRYDVR
jgi:hypothetical protein